MSIKVQDWVADRRFNNATDKNVLMAMASHASDCGSGVWASHQSLGDRAGVSRETAQRSIKRLLDSKLIEKTGKKVNGSIWTHEYKVSLEMLYSMPFTQSAQAVHDRFNNTEVTERHNEEVTLTHGGSDGASQREVTERHTNRPRTVNKPNNNTRGEFLDSNWKPPSGLGDLYLELGLDQSALKQELDKFRDYWVGVSGHRGRKRDWTATWRNWLRNSNTNRRAYSKAQHDRSSQNKKYEKSEQLDAAVIAASSGVGSVYLD